MTRTHLSCLLFVSTMMASAFACSPTEVESSPPIDDGLVGTTEEELSGVPNSNWDLLTLGMASASKPIFYITNGACWPSTPVWGSAPDYHWHSPAPLDAWPNASSGCDAVGRPFTIYAAVLWCGPQTIRISYTIYWPKDGFSCAGGCNGHGHDFEQVVVDWHYQDASHVWPDFVWMSEHGNMKAYKPEHVRWEGQRPVIYVGWAKHAMFTDTGGLWDIGSTLNGNEKRTSDIRAADYALKPMDDSTARRFTSHDWGKATSNPATTNSHLCRYLPLEGARYPE